MVHPIWNEYSALSEELGVIKALMHRSVKIKHPKLEKVIHDYIDAGGKYTRPAMMILFSKMRMNTDQKKTTNQIRYAAAAIELFHLATLFHDDVIDQADTRRGLTALYKQFDNRTAIYAGDYLMSLSGILMEKANYNWLEISLNTSGMNHVLTGEINQLYNMYRQDMTMKDYLIQIKGKTAQLFALSAYFGILEENNEKRAKQAYKAGEELGIAFQIIDDIIDFQADPTNSGKPFMQDVANGIYTAPTLLAMEKSKHITLQHVTNQDEWNLERKQAFYALLAQLNVFDEAYTIAQKFQRKAYQRITKLSDGQSEIESIFNKLLNRKS